MEKQKSKEIIPFVRENGLNLTLRQHEGLWYCGLFGFDNAKFSEGKTIDEAIYFFSKLISLKKINCFEDDNRKNPIDVPLLTHGVYEKKLKYKDVINYESSLEYFPPLGMICIGKISD